MSDYNMTHTGAQLDAAIQRVLDGYILPEGESPEITTNGRHDVKNYEDAVVNVPQGILDYITDSRTAFTAPKMFNAKTYLPNGATVSIPDGYVQPSGNATITANGTHNVKNYENAVVNVPQGYSTVKFKSTTFTPTADSGVITVTGIGFKPKAIGMVISTDTTLAHKVTCAFIWETGANARCVATSTGALARVLGFGSSINISTNNDGFSTNSGYGTFKSGVTYYVYCWG